MFPQDAQHGSSSSGGNRCPSSTRGTNTSLQSPRAAPRPTAMKQHTFRLAPGLLLLLLLLLLLVLLL